MKTQYKKILFSFVLASVISSLSACGKAESNESKYSTEVIIEDTEEKSINTEVVTEYIDEETLELKRREVIINETLKYFDTYQPEYYYEDCLFNEEEIDNILETTLNTKECHFQFDGNIDNLLALIKGNSDEYLKEHSEFVSAFPENGELLLFQTYFKLSIERALEEILENNTNEINEDFHKIQSLKIVFSDTSNCDESYVMGYYDNEQNLIVINYNVISLYAEHCIEFEFGESISNEDKRTKKYNQISELLYLTICHELNHSRQCLCDCRKEDENNSHLSYDGDNIMTIIEASAESELYNLNKIRFYGEDKNTYDYSYPSERNDESLLLLLALSKNENTLDDYYNSIYDADMKDFLDFYSLDNIEDIRKFYNILYIIDGKNNRSQLPYKMYTEDELETKTVLDYEKDIGFAYRNDIFTMSLYNLVEYTKNNNNFCLKDNLMIFNVIKNQIADGALYYVEEDGKYKEAYDESFVLQLVELENKYVDFLGEYYSVSETEIRKIENDLYWYGSCLMDIVLGQSDYTNKYYFESMNLLQEFPVLKAILFSQSYYFDEYNNLIDCNKELILKKSYF